MKIPSAIKSIIKDSNMNEFKEFHVSGDNVFNIDNKYILKISSHTNRLYEEYQKDSWLYKVLPTAKPLKFIVENNIAYYLREYLDGEVLCSPKYLERPNMLIKLLKEALDLFHSASTNGCPFIVGNGETLIHGDFCLPNILVKNDKIVGFIDLGHAGIGDIWCDYAWCIWSFEYNLNTKEYTPYLLKELNIEFNEEKFNYYTKD